MEIIVEKNGKSVEIVMKTRRNLKWKEKKHAENDDRNKKKFFSSFHLSPMKKRRKKKDRQKKPLIKNFGEEDNESDEVKQEESYPKIQSVVLGQSKFLECNLSVRRAATATRQWQSVALLTAFSIFNYENFEWKIKIFSSFL